MGVSAGIKEDDAMAIAFAGGDGFIQRMSALSAAKLASDTALANLNLGLLTKAQLDQAQARNNAADATLTDAKKKADALLAETKVKSESILQDANSKRDKLVAEGNTVYSDATKQLNDAKSKADAIITQANQIKADVEKSKLDVAGMTNDLNLKLTQAKTATAEANEKASRYTKLTAQLKTAIAEFGTKFQDA